MTTKKKGQKNPEYTCQRKGKLPRNNPNGICPSGKVLHSSAFSFPRKTQFIVTALTEGEGVRQIMLLFHQDCGVNVQCVCSPEAAGRIETPQVQVFFKAQSCEPHCRNRSPALRVSAETEARFASLSRSKFVSSLPSLSSGITMLAFSLRNHKERNTKDCSCMRKTDQNTLIHLPLSQM